MVDTGKNVLGTLTALLEQEQAPPNHLVCGGQVDSTVKKLGGILNLEPVFTAQSSLGDRIFPMAQFFAPGSW